jgi:Tfp pilus assembly protein PilO
MNPKRVFAWLVGGGVLAAAGAGALVYLEYESIDESRAAVAELKLSIDGSRKILTGTGALEREVIVLRETEEVIKGILPDEQDLNNLVRDLSHFETEANVQITALKGKPPDNSRKEKNDFDKVGYQLSLEADAFQLMSFMDKVEGHSRFMRIPDFKLSAAPRRQVEDSGVPRHKVQLDVETYVYKPQGGPAPVRIDGYTRKRELLLGEINRRRQALQVATYIYRGQRGRRDPWVDPRVPANVEKETGLSVDEQIRIVDDLVIRTQYALELWKRIGDPQIPLIEEMTTRAELDEHIAKLEEDLRRTQQEGLIRYVPSERRMHNEVVTLINSLREAIQGEEGNHGPSKESLNQLIESMRGLVSSGDYEGAQNAFGTISSRLPIADKDPLRQPLVVELKRLNLQAHDLADFGKIKMDIKGVAIADDIPPVALINDKTLSEGDSLNNELIIRAIRPGSIEFLFRGMILERRF